MPGKVRIRILDDDFEVQAEDSVLHALQLYGVERKLPAYGFTRFCWNAKCKECILELTREGFSGRDFACQTEVCEGLQVHTLPEVLMWLNKIKPSK